MDRLFKSSFIVLMFTAFFAVNRVKAVDLQSLYVKAWLEIQTGFNDKDQKNYRKALADFQDANSILNQIHRTDPNWEAAIVAARMRDCQKMLAELPSLVENTPDVPPPSDGTSPTPPVVPQESATMQQLQMHNTALKAALDRLMTQLQNAQAGLLQYRKEQDLQKGKIAALTQELDALKAQHPGDDTASKQLIAENNDLKEKQAVLEQQIKTLTEGGTNAAVKRLQDQLADVQNQLTASEHANSDLVATNTALKQQLEGAIQKVNQLLAEKGNDEQLQKENIMLRDMLRHELQEQDRKEAARRLAIEEFSNLKVQSRVLKKQIEIITSPVSFLTPEEREFAKTVVVASIPLQGTPKPDFTIAQNAPSVTPAPDATTPVPSVAPQTTSTTPAPDVTNPSSTTPTPSIVAATPTPASNVVDSTPTPSPAPDAANTTPVPAVTQNPIADTTPTPITTPIVQNYQPADVASPTPPPPDNTITTSHTTDSNVAVVESTHIHSAQTTPEPNDPSLISKDPVVPNDMKSLAEEGANLFKMKRYDEAAARYESIIAKYPESLYAWSNLGVVRFQQGDYPESKKALQQAIKLSPNDALCRRNLGIVFYQIGSYEASIDELTQSIAMDSTDPLSHFYLGCACYQKGWLETCVKQVNKSLDLDDQQPDVHLYLSMVYAKEKSQLDEGRKHYKRALDLGESRNESLEKLLQM